MSLVRWSPAGRSVVFVLAAGSIWCLLAEFYGLCSMQLFTLAVLLPAMLALTGIAVWDRVRGPGELWRAVVIGSVAGLVAAVAYDLFRLPFVIAAAKDVGPDWLRLPLFQVFPRFGAMILGQPFTDNQLQSQFTLAAHLVGWIYHFSNGMTFGVMYMALVGDAYKRSWLWAILFATGLEFALLYTPYTTFFAIPLTLTFVVITMAAHAVFGIVLGLLTRRMSSPAAPLQGV